MALRGNEKIKKIPGSSFFAGRRGIIIAVIVAAVIVLLIFSALTRTYHSYQVRVTEKQENTTEYTYYTNGTNVIKCSTTQATLTDRKNNSLWRINYDMGNPAVAARGEVFAIYDRQGSTVKICNESGELGSYNTDMPIVRADVASQGAAAVLQDDGVYAVIDYFDKDGSRIGTIRTTMSQDGYPMDIALSSDGILLAVSFLNFNEGYPQTTVKFYNFGRQGQYRENNVAAQFTMDNTLIPQLEYLDESTCIAFCADKLQVYSGTGSPALRNEIPIEGEIAATFFDESHFGIIERPADGDSYDRIRVFNKGGSQTSSRETDFAYSSVEYQNGIITLYNRNGFAAYTLGGRELFRGHVDEIVRQVLYVKNNQFVCITNEGYMLLLLR